MEKKKSSSERRRRAQENKNNAIHSKEEHAAPEAKAKAKQQTPVSTMMTTNGESVETTKPPPSPRAVITKPQKVLSDQEVEAINKAMLDIDNAEKSDVEDAPDFTDEHDRYILKGKKRVLEMERVETIRRKVCIFSLEFHSYDIVNNTKAPET